MKTISHTDLEPEFKTEECEIKFTRWPQNQMSFADKFCLYILYEVVTIAIPILQKKTLRHREVQKVVSV